jgi:hypothetical protein
LARLRSRSCIIDGEAVTCDDNGVAFSISSGTTTLTRALYAFDLIELNREDLRRDPLEVREGNAGIYRGQGSSGAVTAASALCRDRSMRGERRGFLLGLRAAHSMVAAVTCQQIGT